MKQFLTRTKWWVIPLVWLPVVCWSVSKSVKMGLAPYLAGLIVFLGIITWTLLEYFLHRYLFHIKTKSYWYMLPSHSLCKLASCAESGFINFCKGEHFSLSHSWLPSQAPYGWTAACFPSGWSSTCIFGSMFIFSQLFD